MIRISQEDVALLWNDMEEKSWENLENILQLRIENLDFEEREELLKGISEMKDEPFPATELELYQVLNREVATHPQRIWITDM